MVDPTLRGERFGEGAPKLNPERSRGNTAHDMLHPCRGKTHAEHDIKQKGPLYSVKGLFHVKFKNDTLRAWAFVRWRA